MPIFLDLKHESSFLVLVNYFEDFVSVCVVLYVSDWTEAIMSNN